MPLTLRGFESRRSKMWLENFCSEKKILAAPSVGKGMEKKKKGQASYCRTNFDGRRVSTIFSDPGGGRSVGFGFKRSRR